MSGRRVALSQCDREKDELQGFHFREVDTVASFVKQKTPTGLLIRWGFFSAIPEH